MKTQLGNASLILVSALALSACQTTVSQNQTTQTINAPVAKVILDSDGDGVLDAIDECPETLSYSVVDAKGCTVVIGGDALEMSFAGFFPHMSSQLSNSYTLEFGKIEEKLSEYPEATVFIFGHTASSERDEAAVTHFGSDMLARNRALIVKNMLVLDHGIAAERIHTYDCSNKILATDNDFSDRNVNNIEAKQSRITLMASSEVHDLNNFKYISYEQLYEKYAQQCKPFA